MWPFVGMSLGPEDIIDFGLACKKLRDETVFPNIVTQFLIDLTQAMDSTTERDTQAREVLYFKRRAILEICEQIDSRIQEAEDALNELDNDD